MNSRNHFTKWCLLSTVYALFFAVTWRLGWLPRTLGLDGTYITHGILSILPVMAIYCGRLSWKLDGYLAAQHRRDLEIARYDARFAVARRTEPPNDAFIAQLGQRPKALTFGPQVQELENGSSHGWFSTDACTSLGLIGTVVGFIMMLTSLAARFSSSNLGGAAEGNQVLADMTASMGPAFVTTLAGVVCSLMISLQYHMLDRAIGRLRK